MRFGREFGVTIDKYHSYKDWGLILTDYTISAPKAKTTYVSVPGRNGTLDYSEAVSDEIKYEDRNIKIVFHVPQKQADWRYIISKIQNEIQGRKVKIIFDDDIAFYYYGRIEVDTFSNSGRIATINITAVTDPFKYNITTSAEDWLWDPFDFEQSIINETSGLDVTGSLEVSLECQGAVKNPIIISSSSMTVTYKEKKYGIKTGSQVMYEIVLENGTNVLVFEGNGTVSINYTGGSL